MRAKVICLGFVFGIAGAPIAHAASAAACVTGVSGIFFKSKDPKALSPWYRDTLGITLEKWGSATLRYDAPCHPPAVAWMPFPAKTDDFAPSSREFMIDFGVDALGACIRRLQAKGVKILGRSDTDPSGRFAWIVDSEGLKIELWQAKPK